MADTPPAANPARFAADLVVLVQSELAALAEDREAAETFQALLAIWAGSAAGLLQVANDPRSPAPAWPAPAAAAPDPRDAAIARLAQRVAELERRLAGGD